MNYREALAYLENCTSFGIKPGLERIKRLLKALGNPEQSYQTIHVGGTNGKGSVTSYITHALTSSGVRVGRFTSPHLVSYTERISVNLRDIKEEAFADLIDRVSKVAEQLHQEGCELPTEFEILTAAALLFFKEQEVDYAVIEVGMGGLLDSTNVINPLVTVITNVALDHQAYCGDTIEAIAKHKAGIIKENVPVVTAAQEEAWKIIQRESKNKKSKLYTFGNEFKITSRTSMKTGQMLTVENADKTMAMLFTNLLGIHQAVNISCAYMALKILMAHDTKITEETVREGLARTVWQGRFEVLKIQNRTIILDGAHNENGAESFATTYKELFKEQPKTIVFAALRDKDVKGMLAHIVRPEDYVIVVPAPTIRSFEPSELLSLMGGQAVMEESIESGIEKAFDHAPEGSCIAVCGSLYILGRAKAKLVDMSK